MSIYQRYFRVTSGPLLEKVREIEASNENNRKSLMAFATEIGAKNVFSYRDGTISGFDFDQTPDQAVWKQPNSFGHYMPRKNTAGGKKLIERIQKLPRVISAGEALKTIGLYDGFPVMFGNGKGYTSTLTGTTKLGVMFVSVPWRDIDPEKLYEYKRKNSAGISVSTEMEHLSWSPTPEMQEIKRWEVEKEIDELNVRLRAMAEQKEEVSA